MGKSYFLGDSRQQEQVLKLFNRMQSSVINIKPWIGFDALIWLFSESWDWIVVLQWLQNHGLFKENPHRPPFQAFEDWLQKNHVESRAPYDAHEMSLAHRRILGARYPWENMMVEPGLLNRWVSLYNELSKLMLEISEQ